MESKQIIVLFVIIILLSIGSFWLSDFVMQGYQDCRLNEPYFNHTIPSEPLPDNCAAGVQLLFQVLLQYFGIAILTLLLIPFVQDWRNRQSTKYEIIK